MQNYGSSHALRFICFSWGFCPVFLHTTVQIVFSTDDRLDALKNVLTDCLLHCPFWVYNDSRHHRFPQQSAGFPLAAEHVSVGSLLSFVSGDKRRKGRLLDQRGRNWLHFPFVSVL